jgi:hypothetical protein
VVSVPGAGRDIVCGLWFVVCGVVEFG